MKVSIIFSLNGDQSQLQLDRMFKVTLSQFIELVDEKDIPAKNYITKYHDDSVIKQNILNQQKIGLVSINTTNQTFLF